MQKLLVPIEMLGYQRIYNLERKVQTYLNLYSYFTIKLGIVFIYLFLSMVTQNLYSSLLILYEHAFFLSVYSG